MVRPIEINDQFIDIEKISHISAFDRNIKHDLKKPATIHFFTLIVDGHLVTIQNHDLELLTKDRDMLIAACSIVRQPK